MLLRTEWEIMILKQSGEKIWGKEAKLIDSKKVLILWRNQEDLISTFSHAHHPFDGCY